jgi:murein L,D-transpeptidase YcbB/YkuD
MYSLIFGMRLFFVIESFYMVCFDKTLIRLSVNMSLVAALSGLMLGCVHAKTHIISSQFTNQQTAFAKQMNLDFDNKAKIVSIDDDYQDAVIQEVPASSVNTLQSQPTQIYIPPSIPIPESSAISAIERQNIISFYLSQNNKPVWTEAGMIKPQYAKLFEQSNYLSQHGIKENYYKNLIPNQLSDSFTYDIYLTHSLIKTIEGIKGGILRQTLHDNNIVIDSKAINTVYMLQKLSSSLTPEKILASFTPETTYYSGLMQALQNLRIQQAAGGWQRVYAAGLKVGQAHDGVVNLKKRLQQSGDYELQDMSNRFDKNLLNALQRFQARHGIKPTTFVDNLTLATLNVPIDIRIDQIRLNLERARWINWKNASKELLVNIPDYQLSIFENGKVIKKMRVIVGRKDRASPVFSDQMTYIEFNPYWNVPRSIATKDLLPKFKANRSVASGFKIYLKDQPINGAKINWSQYNATNFPFRIVQDPSKRNSLGTVKFMFPNQFSVYLHDTPHRELFAQHTRTQSSGCVRVEDPKWLAHYLLSNKMTTAQIDQTFASGKNKQVGLPVSVPVHLAYFTAWQDEVGQIQFRDDIYNHDKNLIVLMRKHQVF